MTYVDGYVLAVPTANKAAYKEIAEAFASMFKDHGALSVMECWGDDVPDGEITSMRKAVLLKSDEAVVFSWVIWPSKTVREDGMKKMMDDERMKAMGPEGMPFDGKRMIMGSFESIVEA